MPSIDINKLDLPAKELIETAYQQHKYFNVMFGYKNVDGIVTSRGCPYNCRFCCNLTKSCRQTSPEKAVDEILKAYSAGMEYIRVLDINFTSNRERAMKIFNYIIKENLDIKLEIKSRADAADEELLKTAKKAGVKLISYGMENADQKILDAMNKGIKTDDIVNAVHLTKKHGIMPHTSWVFGYPGETPETIDKTADLIIKIKPFSVNTTFLIPYPSTYVYNSSKENGSLMGDWSVRNSYVPWVKLPWIESKEEIIDYIKKKFLYIYLRPYYIIRYGKEMIKNRNLRLFNYGARVLYDSFCQKSKNIGS